MLPVVRLAFCVLTAAKSASFLRAPTLARRASPLYDVRSEPRLFVPALTLPAAAASRGATTDPPTLGERLARYVRKARLPRSAQAGRRRDHVRKSRHHRIAADGRVRDRE